MNRRTAFGAALLAILFCLSVDLGAQDLVPRAYLVTPIDSNAITIGCSFSDGNVLFDPTVPIADARARFSVQSISGYHAFSLLGRSANIVVSLPYAEGNFNGSLEGVDNSIYRSGLTDARVRLSVNLRGGHAMSVKEFMSWQEKRLLGVSLTVLLPIGQYDPVRLVNPGLNRWAFRPEVGYSRRRGRWVGEGYAGVWFFTTNNQYFPGNTVRAQNPLLALEGHLDYYPDPHRHPRIWASLDGNFLIGGQATVNQAQIYERQLNSRIGGSFSVPFHRHQSLKVSVSTGAYMNIGGDYATVSVAWQYSWIGMGR